MFADDNFKFDENGKKLSKRVENTVGKREIARYEQFLLFPQCFQKAWFPGASKGVIVWEWVKQNTVNKRKKQNADIFLLFQVTFPKTKINQFLSKIYHLQMLPIWHSLNFFPFILSLLYHKSQLLTLSQTSLGFYLSAIQVFWKHFGKRRNCS